jgi:hypothetical protein
MRTTILAILLLVSSTTVDAKLKIETRVDRLTKQTITQADGLKVCQPRDSGAFAKCATVKLAWIATQADSVAIRLEFPETVSIQEVAINVDGVVQAFKATTASTDFGFDPGKQCEHVLDFHSRASCAVQGCFERDTESVRSTLEYRLRFLAPGKNERFASR